MKNLKFWLFLLVFPELDPRTFQLWVWRLIHWATKARGSVRIEFLFINALPKLMLWLQKKVLNFTYRARTGSKLSVKMVKKIFRKSICFYSFSRSYGSPLIPLKKSLKFINLHLFPFQKRGVMGSPYRLTLRRLIFDFLKLYVKHSNKRIICD